MKIIKIVVTRCQILRPKCTKFNFGELTALRRPSIAGFKARTSKGREEKRSEKRGKERGMESETRGDTQIFTWIDAMPPTGVFAP